MNNYRLFREIDLETGIAVLEAYRLNGRLHRDPDEGPAFVTRNPASGLLIKQRYYWLGRIHRANNPARRSYDESGQLVYEQYYRRGLLHRDPKLGPAWIERLMDGSLTASYWVNGRFLRDATAGPSDLTPFFNSGVEHDAPIEPNNRVLKTPRTRKKPGLEPSI